jgi:hypothetical protein
MSVVFAGFLVETLAFAVAVICLIVVVADVWEKWRKGHFR